MPKPSEGIESWSINVYKFPTAKLKSDLIQYDFITFFTLTDNGARNDTEINILRSISHKNIVQYYAHGYINTQADRPMIGICLELCSGGSVEDLLNSKLLDVISRL